MAKAPRAPRKPAAPKPAPTPAPAPAPAPVDAASATAGAADTVLDISSGTDSQPPADTAPPAPAPELSPAQPEVPATAPAVIGLDLASKSDIGARVWMKMSVSMSGPHFTVAPGDCRQFGADEAERLRLAGFAEPTEAPAA